MSIFTRFCVSLTQASKYGKLEGYIIEEQIQSSQPSSKDYEI